MQPPEPRDPDPSDVRTGAVGGAVPPVRSGRRWDVAVAVGCAVFVAVVGVAGTAIDRAEGTLYVDRPPLYAEWLPHAGPGTPLAVAAAVAVIVFGPRAAARCPWRPLLWGAWGAAAAWTLSLALIDGWQRGIAGRLTQKHEYLLAVHRFDDIGAAVRSFTDHIVAFQPGQWPAHVAGHPPAAVLTFVGLDRIGLGGGAWAGMWCVLAGASAVPAVLVALRALGAERWARRAAPFLVLAPAAIWVGASADGYFAAVAAWGTALLAVAAAPARTPRLAAFAAGVLLGWALYLSYGLVLFGLLPLAVLACARTLRPLPYAALGVLAVAAAFTAAGFWWWEGYQLLVVRYYQGVGFDRPYAYWIWGNLANAAIAAGLASAAGLRRVMAAVPGTVRRLRRAPAGGPAVLVVLALAGLCAALLADLSGMSKAETERIWLPFVLWTLPAAALLPVRDHRAWLAVQAVAALLINHLLLTGW
ncbi:hypothetical protein CLV63_11315 [Murinocardiopsis flavida]|uniref:Integral membrane protein n=1 Tax=Murinocardiopsis flavida TaxID=645275 RepID=A0A2P8DF69_9ACTN|nr:hypothetical protein [Murinocardiopsis flavida]PSK95852.1 hypothetical protein CLV63_11315 [Murinocardiopsis flavida]